LGHWVFGILEGKKIVSSLERGRDNLKQERGVSINASMDVRLRLQWA